MGAKCRLVALPTEAAHEGLSNLGVSALFDKIDSFRSLTTGWDGYAARPTRLAAIRIAKLFLSELTGSDLAPDRIKPSVMGGIGIRFRSNDRKCYVEFYNNGTVFAFFSDSQADPETRRVRTTSQEYKLLVKAIQEYLSGGLRPPPGGVPASCD